MSLFTLTGNKLAATVLAAGALVVSGAGVTAVAATLQDNTVAEAESPSPSPTATETESPEPTPTATETESPEPSPTATESESPEPTPTETETASPSPSPTESEEPEPSSSAAAAGPDATGPAAFGLCNAFTNGGLGAKSTARAALVKAAGGESRIVSYCADVTAARDSDDDEAAGTSTGQAVTDEEQTEQPVRQEQERQGAAPGPRGEGNPSGSWNNHSGNSHAKSGGRG